MPAPRETAALLRLSLLVITISNYKHWEILKQLQKMGMHAIAQYSIKLCAEED